MRRTTVSPPRSARASTIQRPASGSGTNAVQPSPTRVASIAASKPPWVGRSRRTSTRSAASASSVRAAQARRDAHAARGGLGRQIEREPERRGALRGAQRGVVAPARRVGVGRRAPDPGATSPRRGRRRAPRPCASSRPAIANGQGSRRRARAGARLAASVLHAAAPGANTKRASRATLCAGSIRALEHEAQRARPPGS